MPIRFVISLFGDVGLEITPHRLEVTESQFAVEQLDLSNRILD
jgi:hypothetical protein